MATYNYSKKDGTLGSVEAADDASALAAASAMADALGNSGVSRVSGGDDTGEDTPANVYKDFNVGAVSGDDKNADRTLNALLTSSGNAANATIETPEQAYRNKLKQFRAEITATENIYAQMLADTKTEGVGRLGTGRAIQARSGLLGSDFAAAQNDKITTSNRDAEDLVRAEKQAKISSILGKVRSDAVAELAEKRAARKAGAEEYLTYLASANERKASKLAKLAGSLLDQGLSIEDIDPAKLKRIAKDYDLSVEEIADAYRTENTVRQTAKAEADAKAKKDLSFEISEGQSYYEYDPATASYKEIASKGKTYAPSSGGGSGTGAGGGTYGSDLDAVIGATISTIPSKFGQAQFQAQLNRARNDGDRISLVAAQVLKNAPATVKTDFANQAVGISEIDKAIKLIDDGVKTGAVEAGAQYVFNVAGRDFDPKLARINAHIISAIQPYRNSITGAAWGTQEDGEYQALFGSTKYSPAELKNRLQSVKETLKNKSSQGLNVYVNPLGTYGNEFDTGYLASEDGVASQVESAGYDYAAIKQTYPDMSDTQILEWISQQ